MAYEYYKATLTYNFKNPKGSSVWTIEKITQEELAAICRRSSGFFNRIFWKIASALNDPHMTLNATRPKVPYICWPIAHESQISLCFALLSLAFQIIEVFDFSIGYNSEFEIFEKKIVKNQKLKISKIPNVVLWGPLRGKFRTSLKTCDLRFVAAVAFWHFHSHWVPC